MDVLNTILIAVGTAAAIAAAVFSWPPFRHSLRRPDLSLVVRGTPHPQDVGGPIRVTFQLALHNDGKTYGKGWRVRIQTPGLEQRIGFPSPILTQNAAGRSHHVTPGEEAWVVEWWAVEEGEAVPPGGPDHPLSVLCEASVPRDGKVVGIYTIVAEGMKPKEGTIEVYATGDISISPEG